MHSPPPDCPLTAEKAGGEVSEGTESPWLVQQCTAVQGATTPQGPDQGRLGLVASLISPVTPGTDQCQGVQFLLTVEGDVLAWARASPATRASLRHEGVCPPRGCHGLPPEPLLPEPLLSEPLPPEPFQPEPLLPELWYSPRYCLSLRPVFLSCASAVW